MHYFCAMLRVAPDPSAYTPLATGVAWLDAELRLAWANPAFSEHTGFGHSRLNAQTLAALQPDGQRLHAVAAHVQQHAQGRAVRGVIVCPAPAVEARLDFSLSPDAGGVWVEVHPVSETTAAPSVSETLRGFAHEVRNPLAAIAGAAQLLQQHAAGPQDRELAQLIRDESARLATLAERLLGARNAMAARAVNVHALLERVAALLNAERAPVTIVRDYDPSLPAWHGDPDRVLQALLNLARNAVEAQATRLILRSRAEAGWRDTHGRRVPALRLEVEDDGDGVPEAITATLFEPMVSGRADGSGLGLALAREIAREHGGELSWRRCAQGSCFVLALPRRAHATEDAR